MIKFSDAVNTAKRLLFPVHPPPMEPPAMELGECEHSSYLLCALPGAGMVIIWDVLVQGYV